MNFTERTPYLTKHEIHELNEALATRIESNYKSLLEPEEEILAIVTLKGAMYFSADLLRLINLPIRMDFVRLASYGSGTSSSGRVRFLKDVEHRPEGRHVLVLDEIVDSGRTLDFLIRRLEADRPKSLRVCTLLDKPSRREVDVNVDFVGQSVEDRFLVGYGLDHDEKYRNLPDIYALDT